MAVHLYADRQRILLVDRNPRKQNLRASILRNYEIEVHAAGSIGEATSLWKSYSYDLVLLAAQESSEDAMLFSEAIRRIKPRQRIALLVGPPGYLRELGGARKKAASVRVSSPVHEEARPMADLAPPQWQETIRKLVTDWYGDQSTLLGLSRMTGAAPRP